jgi:HK97 family phage portal protein
LSNGAAFPAQSEALGETTPLYVGGNYYTQSPLQLDGLFQLYTEMYRRQLWVYTVCRKIGVSTARLGMNLWQPSDGGLIGAADSDYGQLLARPNPRMSSAFMWLWVASTYEIHGEAILLKLRDKRGRVRELHPMHPMNTVVRRIDDSDEIVYIFTSGVRNTTLLPPIPEADVIHFKAYNPDNLMRGMSQLEPLRRTLANEDSIRRATDSWWKRGARPSVALIHPGTISKPAADRLRASWEQRHAGADNMGGTAILEEGMEPKVLQLSAEEMQYIESRKLNREEVCAAADIPPPVVHILDNATYSNITEQMRSMYRDTMAPRLGMWEAELDAQLAPDFDASLQARFNLDEVLRGDFETRADAAVKLVTSGIMQPGEARPLFSLAKAGPEADQLYANQAMQPLGTPVVRTNTTVTVPTTPDGEGEALATAEEQSKAVRSILGRLAGTKAAPDARRQRLVDEHVRRLSSLFARQRDQAAGMAGIAAALAGNTRWKALGDAPTPQEVTAQTGFDPQAWNGALAQQLAVLGTATAQTFGAQAAQQLGGSYDPAHMDAAVQQNAADAAGAINGATLGQLGAALAAGLTAVDAVKRVFGRLTDSGDRLQQIADTRVTQVANQAAESGAKQAGAVFKTWHTGSNPRPEHAQVNGETVRVGQPFSNGLEYPGDGGAKDAAHCNCSLSYARQKEN